MTQQPAAHVSKCLRNINVGVEIRVLISLSLSDGVLRAVIQGQRDQGRKRWRGVRLWRGACRRARSFCGVMWRGEWRRGEEGIAVFVGSHALRIRFASGVYALRIRFFFPPPPGLRCLFCLCNALGTVGSIGVMFGPVVDSVGPGSPSTNRTSASVAMNVPGSPFQSAAISISSSVIPERSPLGRLSETHKKRQMRLQHPSTPRRRRSFTVFGCLGSAVEILASSAT